MHNRPTARTDLISERVEDELVVYDQTNQTAHCLSAMAASVWERCNGSKSPADIALELGADPETVVRALDELRESSLLAAAPHSYSRREAAKRLVGVGGAALAAPFVYSVVVPSAAVAASCTQNASGCTAAGGTATGCTAALSNKGSGPKCCSCTCYNEASVSRCTSTSTCVILAGTCTTASDCCANQAGFTAATCAAGKCTQ